MKLTDAEVRKLTLPAKVADKVFFDDDLPGFGVRVRAGGAQRWMVQYDVPVLWPRRAPWRAIS